MTQTMEALRLSTAQPHLPLLRRHRHHHHHRMHRTTLQPNPCFKPFVAPALSKPVETVPSPLLSSVESPLSPPLPPPFKASTASLQYPPGYVGAVPDRSRSDDGDGLVSPMSYLTNILTSKVYDVAVESPLEFAPKLSERIGANIWLKREDLQPVFSFKLRGAYNMMAKLPEEVLEKGVICSSAGNHAQGVALSAKRLNCNAVIAMPVTTPDIKWKSVERLGATVVLIGDSYDEAQTYAKKRAIEEGRTFIPPFDHPDVIMGQGTVGMETEITNMGSGEMGVAESDGASLPSIGTDAMKRRVTYFYEPTIGDYYYGQGHPMKPHRIRMAHNLVIHYALHRRMQINRPFLAGPEDIRRFHADDYVDFLSSVSPEILSENSHSHYRQLKRFNVGEDCPVFDGLFPFCQASAGGSIGAAVRLNRGDADIAINWAGGLHHAKKAEASGFCYVNDIVLGILELLKVHRRVVYVDIDVHHGDGVEEAFYTTDRVMTVSFHKFGDFFPGTGHIKDTGVGSGKDYAVNVPLNDGMDDENFRALFRPIMQKVMDVYQPDAVVLQCGADSLSGDRLGCFNLSVKGHADCLRFLRSFNVPLMVLGGGGYTVRNVARCWCYETAVAVGVEPSNKLPYNEYYEYFGPDYTLHVEPNNMENLNTPKDMEKIRNMLLEQISRLPHAPSAPFQTTPPTVQVSEEEDEDMDMRPKPRIWNGEDYDSEDDDEYEDEKASIRSSGLTAHMRRSAVDMEEDKPDVKPDVHSSSSS